MTNPRWTRDKPTESGNYWFRYDDKSNAVVVEVFELDDELRFMEDITFYPGTEVDAVSSHSEWSNKPIKEPQ